MNTLISALNSASSVGVLTGAGVSTLSGIPDFRGPQGLYRLPDAERIFDIDWFDRDPRIYYRGAHELVYGLGQFEPNLVHRALVHLETRGLLKGIATQNIDMLHQKAGSKIVHEVHGSPLFHHCRTCGAAFSFDAVMADIAQHGGSEKLGNDYVPRCSCGGVLKPDITFFGESLPEAAFSASVQLAETCDVFLVLGTSLTVYPAANLPRLALQKGAKLFIVNAQPTALDALAAGRYPDLKAFAEAVLAES